ncbi:bacteriohemerythrin [Roseospira visakhapatnamensis]|uniref:Hemerythrin-like metal-binding protein n=1 Tax=Roseospira visakhapatnamensis TaxID=390880 RepID=A0A7W6WB66_9PROT|nr:bacteriohemerythrin [Roseospira visakhapatnamensis]MBB4267498.1 hemerythrin-like metal-binding protein [Roseospira visakhapatnamensis]
MAYIDWSPDLELGIDLVDQDHKVLVALLNQAHECMGDREEAATLGSVLNALVDYTEYHFLREERVMDAAGFSELDEHRELHRRLTRQAREIRDRYAVDPSGVRAVEVMDFLRTWLMDHILKQDFRFRPAVMARPESVDVARTIEFETRDEDHAADGATGAGDSPRDAATVGGPVDFTTMSVLVVDDNQNFQIILRTIFKGLGCPDVRLADGARQGLDALNQAPPSLILVDWRMEGMDGLGFVRAVRDQDITVPIVMITGYNEPGFSDRAREAGVNGFLEKPITARGLVETVSRALHDVRSAA